MRKKTEPLDREIGARVLALRQGRGWNQLDLASRVGIWPGKISRIETGSSGVSAATLAKLAEVLGVSPATLLGKEELAGLDSDLVLALRKLGIERQKKLLQVLDFGIPNEALAA